VTQSAAAPDRAADDSAPIERDPRWRVLARRAVVVAVIVAQAALLVRAYWSDHDEFGFQMFPESSQWQAEIVRITADGDRVPIGEPWPGGYRWEQLVTSRGLRHPAGRHDADAGLANQLAFLRSALDWVAANTPDDDETVRLEATVTYWDNEDGPHVTVYRSDDRPLADGGR
jgi:hypothetical protein